jgi:peptidoglycan/xylan/chitin deacetylase (PgdA/CDA1 family)
VTPFFGSTGERRPLSTADVDVLRACTSEGAQLALHGFTHVSHYRNYASELAGVPTVALRKEVERADSYMHANRLETIGFVAPYNAYDPLTLGVLAERYPLICGGPESVVTLGYRAGPAFLLRSLYVPSYRGAYDVTLEPIARFDRTIAEAGGLTIPVTLHWANEVRDGFRAFRSLCQRLRGRTSRWSDLLSVAAVLEERDGAR